MKNWDKMLFGLLMCASVFTGGLVAAPGENVKQMSKITRDVIANPKGTKDSRGVISLQDYVMEEQVIYDWLFKNHPIFTKYGGKTVGEMVVTDRGKEWLGEGHGFALSQASKRGGVTSMMYRIANNSTLKYPNKFIGPEKCGECHAAQYETWSRSRHYTTIRFPGEHPEFNNNLVDPVFPDSGSILPKGITPDVVYATVGHARTKMGYFDAWLLRGTYYVEGGMLRDGTGTIVAGGNQWQRTWALNMTPDVVAKIRKFVPEFPATMEEYGDNGGYVRGLASYGAKHKKMMYFQTSTSYCEVCHPWKFDFNSQKEFFEALGNPKELQKHTISKGISCEECHGAGGHLEGGDGLRKSNCERCHQRFDMSPDLLKDNRETPELAFSTKFKGMGPACGSEGGQSYFTAHYDKGMRCTTCHDPHDVTGPVTGDQDVKGLNYNPNQGYLSSFYTKPKLKKDCEDCHKEAAYVKSKADTHSKNTCVSCHMPFMMSCEGFYAAQFQDNAGFDTQRRSHIWKIDIDPERKSLVPGSKSKDPRDMAEWHFQRDDKGHNYVDLMWACARTSWADLDMVQTKGCHSPVLSELKETLHFKDQKQVYNEVMGWQTPIKDKYTQVKVGIEGLYALLEVRKLSPSDKARVYELVEKAQQTVDFIEKDGSWGMHGFKYTTQRIDAAIEYVNEAQRIIKKSL